MKSLGYSSVTERGFRTCGGHEVHLQVRGKRGNHISCYNSVLTEGLPRPSAMGARALTFATLVCASEP